MWQNIEVPARATAMPRSIILQQLLDGNSLSQAQSTDLMQGWLNGEIPPATSGAILMALQAKGLSAAELAGMAKVLQAPDTSEAGGSFFTQSLHGVHA
jgi:anthranilate phosphoribosyltransferase